MSENIRAQHLERKAMLYVRQPSPYQVTHNLESQKLPCAMQERLRQLGWREMEVEVSAPGGYLKTEDQRLEKNPDQRVQEAVALGFRKFQELGSVRQTLRWFLEQGLQFPPTRREGSCSGSAPPTRVCIGCSGRRSS